MSDVSIPYAFDWVTARSLCSARDAFRRLFEVVQSDIETAGSVPLRRTPIQLTAESLSGHEFAVAVYWDLGGVVESEEITFELLPDGTITVREADRRGMPRTLFQARPSLSSDGRCRFDVDGATLEAWQVSRKALEPLLFG